MNIREAIAQILIQIKEEIEDLLRPRTIITFAFYGTFLYLVLKGINIPDALNSIVSTLFGYWFGSRQTNGNGKGGDSQEQAKKETEKTTQ